MKIEKMNSQKTFPLEKIRIISCIILLVMTFASCVDYSDEATAISAKVQVTAPEEFTNGSSLEGKTVSLLNAAGNKFTAKTDANGVASFSNLVPDVYTLSTSWELTPAEYAALTGDNVVNEGAVVSGNINNQLIKSQETITLSTSLAINRSLVISKVYYAGSKDNKGKNYLAGQFIELYNQSDKTIDVAGLYIGLLESNATPAYTLDNLKEKFNDSIVVCKQVYRIPTNNREKALLSPTVLLTTLSMHPWNEIC